MYCDGSYKLFGEAQCDSLETDLDARTYAKMRTTTDTLAFVPTEDYSIMRFEQYCAGTPLYSSEAKELLDADELNSAAPGTSWNDVKFLGLAYRAIQKCAENTTCRYVSVWMDATYRLYGDGQCESTKADVASRTYAHKPATIDTLLYVPAEDSSIERFREDCNGHPLYTSEPWELLELNETEKFASTSTNDLTSLRYTLRAIQECREAVEKSAYFPAEGVSLKRVEHYCDGQPLYISVPWELLNASEPRIRATTSSRDAAFVEYSARAAQICGKGTWAHCKYFTVYADASYKLFGERQCDSMKYDVASRTYNKITQSLGPCKYVTVHDDASFKLFSEGQCDSTNSSLTSHIYANRPPASVDALAYYPTKDFSIKRFDYYCCGTPMNSSTSKPWALLEPGESRTRASPVSDDFTFLRYSLRALQKCRDDPICRYVTVNDDASFMLFGDGQCDFSTTKFSLASRIYTKDPLDVSIEAIARVPSEDFSLKRYFQSCDGTPLYISAPWALLDLGELRTISTSKSTDVTLMRYSRRAMIKCRYRPNCKYFTVYVDASFKLFSEGECDSTTYDRKARTYSNESPKLLEAAWAHRFGQHGPLVDSISISPGASYIRPKALTKNWRDAFLSIAPVVQEQQGDRFCTFDEVGSTSNFMVALDRCDRNETEKTLQSSAIYEGCYNGYAAYEDTNVSPDAGVAHVWRSQVLTFHDTNGAKSVLSRCEAICQGYPHLGLSLRPHAGFYANQGPREVDCTCGFLFNRYRNDTNVALDARPYACDGTYGSEGCGTGPCGHGKLTAVYKPPFTPRSLGIKHMGCRRGYVKFEKKSSVGNTVAAKKGESAMLGQTFGYSEASAYISIDVPVIKGERVGGESGPFANCIQKCRGYPYLATSLNTDGSVLKCTCGFRLVEYDRFYPKQKDTISPDECTGGHLVDCDFGPCGSVTNDVESIFILPGSFAFEDMNSLSYHGCFKSDPSELTLTYRAESRKDVDRGQGFSALQACAKACARQRLPFEFIGLNRDGCYCGQVAPDPDGPFGLKNERCQDSRNNPN